MGIQEPGSRSLRKARGSFRNLLLFTLLASFIIGNSAQAQFDLGGNVFKIGSSWSISSNDLRQLINHAHQALNRQLQYGGFVADGQTQYIADAAVGDPRLPTIKFKQVYRGVEVFGNRAMVHYRGGRVNDITKNPLDVAMNVQPAYSAQDAQRIVMSLFKKRVAFEGAPQLRIFKGPDKQTRLVYIMKTRSMPGHDGRVIYLDAHRGAAVLVYKRTITEGLNRNGNPENEGAHVFFNPRRYPRMSFEGIPLSVYSAATDEARSHNDWEGYPTDINFEWYDKMYEDQWRSDKSDDSADRAYKNSGIVYRYYRDNFNRKSTDDKDGRINSVVHMGIMMNNAFWADEFKVIAYGDGDGDHLIDLTNGLDVAAHEMTHAVTSSEANLVYAAEPGALNEAYSDFFGKMVDFNGDWYIGAAIMSPKWNRKALRNMINPEEFQQPGSNDSSLKVPTTGNCYGGNDYCGVHTNSGIPNRASALIVQAIGKQKAEQLYYKVLTERLSENSGFAEARKQTEEECGRMFGASSVDCQKVKEAFDIVKM